MSLGVWAFCFDGAGEREHDRLARLQSDDPQADLKAGRNPPRSNGLVR